MATNIEFLRKGYLFETLLPEELEAIAQIAKEKDIIAGDYVFDEGAKLIEIGYNDLENVINAQPAIGNKMFRSLAAVLCRRIRQTTGDLSSLKELKLRHV